MHIVWDRKQKDMNRAEGEHGHQTHSVTGEEHSEYIFVKDSSSANNLRTTRNSGGRPGAQMPLLPMLQTMHYASMLLPLYATVPLPTKFHR